MAKIQKRERWSSGIDVLNVTLPASIPHKTLVSMSNQLGLSEFAFRPMEDGRRAGEIWSVRDIVEFRGSCVRFILFENEDLDHCALYIEFIDTDRQPTDHPGHRFEMKRID